MPARLQQEEELWTAQMQRAVLHGKDCLMNTDSLRPHYPTFFTTYEAKGAGDGYMYLINIGFRNFGCTV